MNYSIDKAILCEACGQMEEALCFWIQVATHWATCSNRYELPMRTRLVLCQEKITDTVIPLLKDKVNQFLLQKLNYLSLLTNMKLNDIIGDKQLSDITDILALSKISGSIIIAA
jgi:hypothetical protein